MILRLVTLLISAVVLVAPAAASEMFWQLSNQKPYETVFELYSQERDKVWPGNDKVYLLDPKQRKSVQIECIEGERICWGAWRYGDDRQSFGVGPDSTKNCRECCLICVSGTREAVEVAE